MRLNGRGGRHGSEFTGSHLSAILVSFFTCLLACNSLRGCVIYLCSRTNKSDSGVEQKSRYVATQYLVMLDPEGFAQHDQTYGLQTSRLHPSTAHPPTLTISPISGTYSFTRLPRSIAIL